MALLDEMRAAVRVMSDMTDDEIQTWIDAAIADMRRCGVLPELLVEESLSPLAKSAVTNYVRANYGLDNSESTRFHESYNLTVTNLMNSDMSDWLHESED